MENISVGQLANILIRHFFFWCSSKEMPNSHFQASGQVLGEPMLKMVKSVRCFISLGFTVSFIRSSNICKVNIFLFNVLNSVPCGTQSTEMKMVSVLKELAI